MRFQYFAIFALFFAVALSLPHILSEAESKYALCARSGRSTPADGVNGARPRPHPVVAFLQTAGRILSDWFHGIITMIPRFAFERSAEFMINQRPSVGSSVIYTHMDAGIVTDEVHFGDMHAYLASGRKFLVKTVPSMTKAIYRRFDPDLRPRDRWRKQQVAGLMTARREAMQVSEGKWPPSQLGLIPGDNNAQTEDLRTVSVLVPDHELINQFSMLSDIEEKDLSKQQQADRQTVIIDNRSERTLGLVAIPYTGVAREVLRSDYDKQERPIVVNIKKPQGPPAESRPQDTTSGNLQIVDASSAKWLGTKVDRKRDHVTRDNPISSIANQEGNAASGTGNDTASSQAEFQQYVNAFNVARSNVSDLIFPFLDTILANTNSSIVYDAAWSIYSDLTGSSPYVMGPFFHGLNCIEWIEDQLALNGTNITSPSPSMNATENLARMEYLAVHQVLLELYDYAYHGAVSAINQTGLMEDMVTLAQYFAPTDTSVFPAGYSTYIQPSYDASYFMVYNETMSPNVTFSNLPPKG